MLGHWKGPISVQRSVPELVFSCGIWPLGTYRLTLPHLLTHSRPPESDPLSGVLYKFTLKALSIFQGGGHPDVYIFLYYRRLSAALRYLIPYHIFIAFLLYNRKFSMYLIILISRCHNFLFTFSLKVQISLWYLI